VRTGKVYLAERAAYDEAEPRLLESLEIRERALPGGDETIVQTLATLASL